MTLANWQANGWLSEHEPTVQEINDLFAVVDRDLDDAAIEGLSADRRLGIAYNAALQLANIALAASRLRSDKQRAHERAIRSLEFTIGASPALVDTLDGIRRKRNQTNYTRAGTSSSSEAEEVYHLATALRTSVVSWLKTHHPDLALGI